MSKTEVTYGNQMYHLDEENEVKNLVNIVFDEIEKAIDKEVLSEILNKFEDKYKMPDDKYKKIEFKIEKQEFDDIVDFTFEKDDTILINDKIKDNTLAKLLYALAWKNGDLLKLKHIIKGIKNEGKNDEDKDDGLVFYQFGKYLTKEKGQPIVDQHVLRAFAISERMKKTDRINYSTPQWQKMHLINKTNKFLIDDYKEWLNSENIKESLKQEEDYSYNIDKILFALGKTIKHK